MTTNTNNIVTMPTSPNFTDSEWELVRTIGLTISPYTGQQRTQEFGNTYYGATLTLPPMKRNQAALWQSFLINCKGPTNSFQMSDPDGKTNQGTYNQTHLTASRRVNDTSETLSFSGSTITAGTSIFGSLIAGDFVHVTGAINEENNGTHKISSVTNATTIITTSTLTSESSTASCSIQQNVSGATGLALTTINSGTGTIKAGDYLGVLSGNSASHQPFQLLMVTEDAVQSGTSVAVHTEPRLRKDLTDGYFVIFNEPKGLFRLVEKNIRWSANAASTYGFSFQVVEDIGASNT
tara:strand:+ start:663 stop:1544 length:882 start_codon:yes stop_codon:yes gene_type:complete